MGKIAFLFPGQGAQYVGMGRELHDQLPAARQLYQQADAVLGYRLSELCFSGPAEELDSTLVSQPALFVTSLAALEWLRAESPEVVLGCEATAGLSLGEYTALVFSGVMEFEAALQIVQRRGEAMQAAADATSSGMVSILGLDRDQVALLCNEAAAHGHIEVANYLCPGNIVVSGTKSACEAAAELAEQHGAMKAIPLAVAGAFHTRIMEPADERLSAALAEVRMNRPEIAVVSNVDAKAHDDPDEIRQLLIRQVVNPVRWEESMTYLLGQGFDTFYEIGPGRVLRGLLRRISRKVSCQCVMGPG